jgi:hypothetical protein
MAKKTSDVYLFNTDGTVTVERNVPKPDLSRLQGLVGGLIEYVYHAKLAKSKGVDVIANEEGFCLGMRLNYAANKYLSCDLVGPVVVVDNRSDRSVSPFLTPPV